MTTPIADPVAFWEQRHASSDPWRSGGDRGITVAENFELYALRLAQVISIIRSTRGGERGLAILDAGCGRGHLTDSLRRCGHRVVGIDSSPTAIEKAIENYGAPFECCQLSDFKPDRLFDVIVCMDVLFHVLDDEVWNASIDRLCQCASAESTLAISDAFAAERFGLGDYIIHRSAAEYDRALQRHGFVRQSFAPYGFGANPNGFAAYTRKI